MGQSTITEWINENAHRAYPLTVDSTKEAVGNDTPMDLHKIILDANLVYVDDDMPEQVKLEKIESDGVDITLYVSGENSVPFVVTEALTAEYPVYIRNDRGSLLVIGEAVKACLLGAQPSIELSGVVFEPSVCSEVRGRLRGVTSLTLANNMLVGDIELVEGFQTGIEFQDKNVLYIAAGNSEGLPLDCRNFFANELEYDCGDIVSWINGATASENGGTLKLIAGRNIKIYEDKEYNKIFIGLDFDPEDICVVPALPPN